MRREAAVPAVATGVDAVTAATVAVDAVAVAAAVPTVPSNRHILYETRRRVAGLAILLFFVYLSIQYLMNIPMSEENVKNPMDLNGDGKVTFGEKVQYKAGQAADKAKDVYAKASEKVKDAYADAKEDFAEAKDKAKEVYAKASEKVKDAYADAKEDFVEAKDLAKSKIQELKDKKA